MSSDVTTPAAARNRRLLIAPAWHTLSFLLILGVFAFYDARHARSAGAPQAVAPHTAILSAYLLPILYEWGMAAWAWGGVLFRNGHLRDLTGGRWRSWRSLVVDVAIAVPFWVVWELTARLVHLGVNRVPTPTTPYHPPSGFTEVCLWILLSVSGGICEEIIYRGYFQQQLHAATRSVAAAVVLQGLLFGLVHAYQGLETGDHDCTAGNFVWRACGLAPQPSRQHDCPRLVGHIRGLVALPMSCHACQGVRPY